MTFDEAKTLLYEIITINKRGYMNVIHYKYPELEKTILNLTAFSNKPGRDWKTRIWYILNNFTDYPKCLHDGKPIIRNIYKLHKPMMVYCCAKCVGADELHKKHMSDTNIRLYGNEIAMRNDKIKEKLKKSIAFQDKQKLSDKKSVSQKTSWAHPIIKRLRLEKTKISNRKRHGYDFESQTPEAKERASLKLKENHWKVSKAKKVNYYNTIICNDNNVEPLFSVSEYARLNRSNIRSTDLPWKCKHCGNIFVGKVKPCYFIDGIHDATHHVLARCPVCHPIANTASLEEKHLAKYIRSICDDKYEVINNKEDNFKIIQPYQLDIIIRDKITKKILFTIEYNGNRWHSLDMRPGGANRQLTKTVRCEALGIPLVHVFEDEWLYDRKNTERLLAEYASGRFDSLNFSDDTVEIDRSKFCKAVPIQGYRLVGETPPRAIERKGLECFGRNVYKVPDCGKLIYERI